MEDTNKQPKELIIPITIEKDDPVSSSDNKEQAKNKSVSDEENIPKSGASTPQRKSSRLLQKAECASNTDEKLIDNDLKKDNKETEDKNVDDVDSIAEKPIDKDSSADTIKEDSFSGNSSIDEKSVDKKDSYAERTKKKSSSDISIDEKPIDKDSTDENSTTLTLNDGKSTTTSDLDDITGTDSCGNSETTLNTSFQSDIDEHCAEVIACVGRDKKPLAIVTAYKKPEEESVVLKRRIQVRPLVEPDGQLWRQYQEFTEHHQLGESEVQCTTSNEEIVIVIDRAHDEEFTSFNMGNNGVKPLEMMKRAILIFIKLKNIINKNHKFAVVVLNESNASWILNFTNDMAKLKDTINKITECKAEDVFNLNAMFDELLDNVAVPYNIAPSFVLRAIVCYGRSYTMPECVINEELADLLYSPFFTCDIIMTHEPVSASNNCNKIFAELQNLDTKGFAYFFPVSRDARRLHEAMGKLLGYPLQRPLQNRFNNSNNN